MEQIQPSILPGFMELLPKEQVLFEEVKDVIRRNFETFGFWPLDTPGIEKNEILFAKGGGETTKQIYRIEKGNSSQEQSLRFDLTVPLARYVAQYQSQLTFPFRRYQIAKVYRGERNQKGRYREFYQADIDIIGHETLSPLNDAEAPAVIYRIFQDLHIPGVRFHVNHRGLLNGFMETQGIADPTAVLHAVDKKDKIGAEKLGVLLEEAGVTPAQQEAVFAFIGVTDTRPAKERLEAYAKSLGESEPGADAFRQGLEEMEQIISAMQRFGVPEQAIERDLSITRGLDYYTGIVYETTLDGYESIGSVASGGRYDNLASNFTKTQLPGVGISIGLTRLFYQLREAGLIATKDGGFLDAVVIPMSENEFPAAMEAVTLLRGKGLHAQMFAEKGKMKKKFSYIDALGARYALIIGETEREQGQWSLKDMETGEQETKMPEEAMQQMLEAGRKEII